jgi:molybdate transport system substrate-binding protein
VLTGPLTVLAAASLTEAFNDTKTTLEREHAGLHITYSFAGSQALVTQIVNGAPADVVATADETTMSRLVTAALVETPTVFAHNRLEIAVAPGNPRGIRGLADLAAPNLTVVLADPSVPAGKFAQQALQKAGVTVTPKSLELDVKSVLQKVAIGEADAGIVYVTDVTAAGATVAGVPIPDTQNVIATYPIAVVKATTHHAAAAAFVTEIVSGVGRQALRKHGFLGP